MKSFNLTLMIVCLISFLPSEIFAQDINISGEIRPRFEFRNGYKAPMPDGNDPASFISQRTRLNAFYGNTNFRSKLVLQDVRVWGDVPQLNKSDAYGTSLHEAWGEVIFSNKFSIKLGRQEIIYDDQRIFASSNWAQQARSHDAAIIKYSPSSNHQFDLGLAYNANGESLYKVDYIVNNYKTFQYLHYHGNFDKIGLSFLALNNGMAYTSTTDSTQNIAYSQTIGPRLTFKGDEVMFNAAFYYQGGKNKFNNSLSAIYFSANVSYALSSKFTLGLGGEYLSGTSSENQANANENDKSFKPFYGANHKFNGWMDYFFVGSYMYSNGLLDIYLPLTLKVDKFTFKLIPHYFMAAATVAQQEEDGTWKDFSSGLGAEIDFTASYTFNKNVVVSAGYSQMMANESMQVLKGGNHKNTNNWAWVMFTFKPTFFQSK
ncbi:MAG: alginate export family protein [Lentimicrobiaceae bacterium]|jgi:hypothetical protein|nr:alginate export family protein [Lentimicrobiaceae bacterium]MCP4910283.1 alginate export family protein [Bacteroidota bacterium]MBT3453852.1 alginate export family protein [Lentimicrobiaceae bacterium]MBT3818958.1 alginate export family protein [Lentimicrobiaceae bacterium]MBT4060726.1 alginate export family protein [Lentimicrobiaceae bacterium]